MSHLQDCVTLNLTSDLVFIIIILFLHINCILEWRIVLFHFPVTVTLTSDVVTRIGIISIFFEVIIPNLVCGCFLGWPSVAYPFGVTVTLTSDLVFRIIMFRAFFSILFKPGIPNLMCGCIFGWQSFMYQFCDLHLISRIILSGAYLIYYLREESKICCMDTSLGADMSHTILGHCDLDLWPSF